MSSYAHIPCRFHSCPLRTIDGHYCPRIVEMVRRVEVDRGLYIICIFG
jgi:hypothetical protein